MANDEEELQKLFALQVIAMAGDAEDGDDSCRRMLQTMLGLDELVS